MFISELKSHTKCRVYVERVDADGAVRRTQWDEGAPDYRIDTIKIVHTTMQGFGLAVTLDEEGE